MLPAGSVRLVAGSYNITSRVCEIRKKSHTVLPAGSVRLVTGS